MASTVRTERRAAGFNPTDPIGSILQRSLNKIENTIDQEINRIHDATTDIIIRAGEQASQLITSLQTAYEDSLELTYEKADKLLKQNIDRIDDLVTDITKQEVEALNQVADRIETIVKLSPLSNWWLPLLSDVKPRFVAIAGANPENPSQAVTTQVSVIFKGNFAFADRKGCTPKLKLYDTEYSPVGNTTKELTFEVNISSSNPDVHLHNYSFLKGKLIVLWQKHLWSWVTSDYAFRIGVLPSTIGTITTLFSKGPAKESQIFESNVVEVGRNKSHWQTQQITVGPHQGWHVVRGSSELRWVEKRGSQINHTFISDSYDQVTYEYSNKDGSGKFKILFTESKDVSEVEREEVLDSLCWDNSVIVAPRQNERIVRITFRAFNGDSFQFQPRSDRDNPFITLRELDGTIQIKARSVGEINQPGGSMHAIRTIHRLKRSDGDDYKQA